MSKKCHAWAVAAAYLLDGGYKHFWDISDFIEKSGITTLGEKGDTPRQTVGSILRSKVIYSEKVFEKDDFQEGYYSLYDADSIKEHKDVQHALERLKENEKK